MTSPPPVRPAARGWHPPATFAALQHRNYRLWFSGQTLPMLGFWMQNVAQGWLVYELTGSKLALGTISFIGAIPSLFLMIPAGALCDRMSRRTLLVITSSVGMATSFALAALAALGMLQVWHIGVLAFILGLSNAFDMPARQSLVVDLVEDRSHLLNAIALNSTLFNLARVVGPAAGGALLAIAGPAWCFGINGAGYIVAIIAMYQMRLPSVALNSARESMTRQIMEGLRYVRGQKAIISITALMGMTSLFGMAYMTLMPAFAVDVLHSGETGLGVLNAAVGIGALVGSLIVATLAGSRHQGMLITVGSIVAPLASIAFGFSRDLTLSLAVLPVLGCALVALSSTATTLVQSVIPDELRGRVMGVYSLVFFGMMPFGSLLAGVIAQELGPALGVALGALVALAFGVFVVLAVPRVRRFGT